MRKTAEPVGKKYLDDLLLPMRNAHAMDTLLSHEVTDTGRSCDSNNMVDVVRPNSFILHAFIQYRTYFFDGCEVNLNSKVVAAIQHCDFGRSLRHAECSLMQHFIDA